MVSMCDPTRSWDRPLTLRLNHFRDLLSPWNRLSEITLRFFPCPAQLLQLPQEGKKGGFREVSRSHGACLDAGTAQYALRTIGFCDIVAVYGILGTGLDAFVASGAEGFVGFGRDGAVLPNCSQSTQALRFDVRSMAGDADWWCRLKGFDVQHLVPMAEPNSRAAWRSASSGRPGAMGISSVE